MEEDDKSYEGEEERELLGEEDDGDLIQVDHKLQAQEFGFDSKFFSRFSVCTLLVGCYWFYPEILVRNTSPVGKQGTKGACTYDVRTGRGEGSPISRQSKGGCINFVL